MSLHVPSSQDIITFIVSLFGGSAIGWLFVKYHIQNEAKAALTEDLHNIHKTLDEHDKRMQSIEHDYVQCRFCDMQYKSVHSLLDSMDSKLNILLEKQMH